MVHYLRGLAPSEEQSLQALSKKFITLLTHTNASCASDVHTHDLKHHFSEKGVPLHILTLTKIGLSQDNYYFKG